MLITNIECNYKNLKGFKTLERISYEQNHLVDNKAEKRLKILLFWKKHGLEATKEAYEISERTLYNWKKKYKQGGNKTYFLSDKNKSPKQKRKRKWDYQILEEVTKIRAKYPNLGKEKIQPILKQFCILKNLKTPGISTIGRLIKDMGGLRQDTRKKKISHRQGILRKPDNLKAKFPGDVVALDSVEVRIEGGTKRYVVTIIDLYSRFSYAVVTSSHSSKTAMNILKSFEDKFPYEIKSILTDNGSEFALNFRKYLNDKKITHYHTYPSSPKMNAHCERYNRTIREGVLNLNRYKLIDLEVANKLVGEFLAFYNSKRVHYAFKNKLTPLQKLMLYDNIKSQNKNCNLGGTYTIFRQTNFFQYNKLLYKKNKYFFTIITMLFKDLDIISPILKSLEREGYSTPTPIQEKAIPHILAGKDVLGSAQTGTGKTAAFAIPTLQILSREKELSNQPRTIKSLILTPTRELAIQIEESFTAYGKDLGLRHAVIFGGVSQHSQVDKLKKGIDILVATPGRLLDLINQGFVNLKNVEIFILDEADRMLNMGFINDVKKVLTKLPNKKQTLFFSATMPPEIMKLADSILVNPVKVAVTPISQTADTVRQAVYFVKKNDKKLLLASLLKNTSLVSVLVFSRTKHGADRIVKDLEKSGFKAEAIHGNKSQNARQRALGNFKSGSTRVLVATDIAARGIDVDNLSHVINYDLPNESETYVHRIGRTGRAGQSGIAISFCDQEEVEYLLDIQKLIGKILPVVENHSFAIQVNMSKKPVAKKPQQQVQKNFNSPRNKFSSERKRNFGR